MTYAAEELMPCCTAYTLPQLLEAAAHRTILQSTALLYDTDKSLHFRLGKTPALMPHEACALGAGSGQVRDIAIITRVGRPACFVITGTPTRDAPHFTLSRAEAQRRCRTEYLDLLQPGDVIECVATHIEPFGVFCDVGCGISALLPIDCLSVSRITTPADRIRTGQRLRCAVRWRDEQGRLILTMKELLGSWAENAALFRPGMTVVGRVRSVEEYGVFIELTPNLAGLAEYSGELAPGDAVSVYIKNILPQKMKVKLVVLSQLPAPAAPPPLQLFFEGEHLDRWVYSCPGARRTICTDFSEALPARGG